MKVEPKHLFIGAAVIAIIIVACAYKFGYAPFIEKADKLKSENQALENRKNELTEKMANRTMYVEGIEVSEKIIDSVLKKYGPGNTPEKTIMMIVDLCQKVGVEIRTISFSNEKPFFEIGSKTEESDNLRIMSSCTTNISVVGGYTQTKKFFDYINNYPERMTVNNFSSSYSDDIGKLASSVALNLYGVQDKDHVYVAPVVEGIDLGVNNIFRYEIIPSEEELEGMEENAGE